MYTFSDEGGGVNAAYAEVVEAMASDGAKVDSRVAPTIELHPSIIQINNPRRRLVTAWGRPINVAFALAEVIWILNGRSDVAMPAFYNSRFPDYSDDGLRTNAAYGHRIRHAVGYDQLEDVLRLLLRDPGSRQATIAIWHPNDRAHEVLHVHNEGDGTPGLQWTPRETKDRACNLLAHLMIRNGRLDWLQTMRSNDLIWGTPYNWMQFMHLQEFCAGILGVEVGSYLHIADSLHVYDYHYGDLAGIQMFDLYSVFEEDHLPMWGQGGVDLEAALLYPAYLNACEENIRNRGVMEPHDYLNRRDVYREDWRLSHYWRQVMWILLSWRAYKEGQDEVALELLLTPDGDRVLAAAQARFYWTNRWGTDRFREASEDSFERLQNATRDAWPQSVADWVTGALLGA